MSLFNAPTAEDVLEDAGLKPVQIGGPSYTEEDALADITQKIQAATVAVENRLVAAAEPHPWPFSDGQLAAALPGSEPAYRTAYTERQQANAALAVKWLALSYLYRRSGQLNKAYPDKADEYAALAEGLLAGSGEGADTGLIGQVSGIVDRLRGQSCIVTAVKPTRVDGYSACGSEYARGRCY